MTLLLVMFLFFDYDHRRLLTTVWQWLLFSLIINLTCSQQIYVSQLILSNPGTQFVPVDMPAQLISTVQTNSIKSCAALCNNNILCRVFDYGVSVPNQCRLFEGDTSTLGQIVASSSSQSYVGTVQVSADLFAEYGSPCTSFCYHSRYLQCNNFTCGCIPHTYWNPSSSMCVPQSPILGASCQQNMSMCREDLNYTCLQFNQCGPLSVLSGTTVINRNTTIVGSSTVGISFPFGIAMATTNTDSLIIADEGHNRIVGLWNIGTATENTSVVATQWGTGQSLSSPYNVYVDTRNGSNLYVTDYYTAQVILYSNLQSFSPPPRVVAGKGQTQGPAPAYLNNPFGIQVDRHYNVFVASMATNSILMWPPNSTNSTNGTMVVGLGAASATSMGLNAPCRILLDEVNSWLYVADANNNRIQRYSINGTWPCNGTTVAGGNGQGNGSSQLNKPRDIWISQKTGAMYIVESGNNRIQRWAKGATQGVTIAGDPAGTSGSTALKFNNPLTIAVNANETQMYVSDSNNHRIQRFQLI